MAPSSLLLAIMDREGETTPKGYDEDFTVSIVLKKIFSTNVSMCLAKLRGKALFIRVFVSVKSLIGIRIRDLDFTSGKTPSSDQERMKMIFPKKVSGDI